MTTLKRIGDEVQGERLVCFYGKRDREVLIPLTKRHRGWRVKLHGLPLSTSILPAFLRQIA